MPISFPVNEIYSDGIQDPISFARDDGSCCKYHREGSVPSSSFLSSFFVVKGRLLCWRMLKKDDSGIVYPD